jgi:outer membrane protein assembly factor BamB
VSSRRFLVLGLVGGALGCGQLTATWDTSPAEPASRAYGVGQVAMPEPTGDGGAAGGAGEPKPHPAGCGDRRSSGFVPRDTNASCALPASDEVLPDDGTLPNAARGVPTLVLGDDALLAENGAMQASLYDLFTGRERVSFPLGATFIAPQAVANDDLVCLVLGPSLLELQCFDRRGQSLWKLLVSQRGTMRDLLLDESMIWAEYSNGGFGELLGISLATGTITWRYPLLGLNGGIVRVGDALVGYDQVSCAELAVPGPCLRAIDARSGASLATMATSYLNLAWQTSERAVFSDGIELYEYTASGSSFRNVTSELAPLVDGLGTASLYAQGTLDDGRVLVAGAGASPELVVVDPASLTFKKLGIPVPKLLRVHGDLLVADGVVVSLTDTPAPVMTAASWFGIFGFESSSSTFARKIK